VIHGMQWSFSHCTQHAIQVNIGHDKGTKIIIEGHEFVEEGMPNL